MPGAGQRRCDRLDPSPERYLASIREYADAGYTELYLHNIGPDQQGFLDFFQREVRPRIG